MLSTWTNSDRNNLNLGSKLIRRKRAQIYCDLCIFSQLPKRFIYFSFPTQVEDVLDQVKEEPVPEEEPGGSSMVLDATAEFCRTLGDIPTYGLAGNREHHAEIMVSHRHDHNDWCSNSWKYLDVIWVLFVLKSCFLVGFRAWGYGSGAGGGQQRRCVESRRRRQWKAGWFSCRFVWWHSIIMCMSHTYILIGSLLLFRISTLSYIKPILRSLEIEYYWL